MIETLGRYLPQDRLRALCRAEELPKRALGSALFADISGFTTLTEKLAQLHGPRRGIEILMQQINTVYTALVGEIERYGGSVVNFAGDSITCWFDLEAGQPAGRASACAQSMQMAMQAFPELSLKIAVSSGPVRRLVLGDPTIRLLDTLAGRTITRLATAEHLARPAEIILDEASAISLQFPIREWRSADSAERFAVLELATQTVAVGELALNAGLADLSIEAEVLRPWLLRAVYERETQGHALFLTELRPTVALFVRLLGIDYDEDAQAEEKLNAIVCQVQAILQKYEGALLEFTVGDKGSYFYASFGAVSAHEDDARRAVQAALEINQLLADLPYPVIHQLGLSAGTMRTGAYGSPTRQSYSALGDEVNLDARLMTTAAPGEILISRRVQKLVADLFSVEPRSPLFIKGKAEPLPVFSVTGLIRVRAARLPEPTYRLPMVGRQTELNLVDEKLRLALQGSGQVLGIVAQAGMGKSRLVAEIIRLAHRLGFTGYGGGCQSSGANTPYLPWHNIWQAFFDLDPDMPQKKQLRLLESELEERAPARLEALPLLGLVLNLPLADNDFTRALEPRDRKSTLEVVLEDCLRSAARETPMLIILEDLHWIDQLSYDLLETLLRVSATLPVCFVLAFRPAERGSLYKHGLEELVNFTKIELKELVASDVELLIRAKLAQLFPERSESLPMALTEQLTVQAQGNPFYIEELLNYLHDRGVDPFDTHALAALELPASLQTIILSRIDQLSEPQKVILKVASVIGRIFPFAWLQGYYPALGDASHLKANLEELSRLDLTLLDLPEPELAYIFKHIVTQEVAYESLAYATRTQLHELLACYLEETHSGSIPLETIAFHYSRSANLPKKREYLQRAGLAAQLVYANTAALAYFEQALAAEPDPSEFIDLHLKMGKTLQLVGRLDEAYAHFMEALRVAEENKLAHMLLEAQINLGMWHEQRGEYQPALEWLEKARGLSTQAADTAGLCSAISETGSVYWRMGNFETARQYTQAGLELARQLGDQKQEVDSLLMVAAINGEQGNYSESHKAFAAALVISRDLSDKRRSATIFSNSGTIHYFEGNYAVAQGFWQKGQAFYREIGDRRSITITYNNLGNIYFLKNDYETAQKYYNESLAESRAANDKYAMSISLSALGITAFQLGHYAEANDYYQQSLILGRALDYRVGLSLLHCYLGLLALAQGQIEAARAAFTEGLTTSHQSDIKSYAVYNLIGFAMIALKQEDVPGSVRLLAAASALAGSIGLKIEPELEKPYTLSLQQARAALSEAEFDDLWQTGLKISLDAAVRLALIG